ncbi:MAG TPA: ATP-binding protein [Methylomirabilota bacterium]|nr:ATP-binding protein [Methylomirabilota bacterium]
MALVDFLVDLARNLALLLALTLLYSVVRRSWTRARPALRAIFAGGVFGLIAIAGMHTPFVVAPGVLADARYIPLLLAGPFGGPGAAVTAAALASIYRAALGGVGSMAGIGTIVTVGAFAVFVGKHWRGRERELQPMTLLALGVALDIIALVWAVALPDRATALHIVGIAAVPVGLFLPLGTVGLGMLLVNESRRHEERERLVLTQFALDRAAEALFWIDADGRVLNANPAAERLTGFTRAELLQRHLWDLEVDGDPARWQRFWETVRAEGSRSSEMRFRRRDGGEVPVEASNDYIAHRGREWISLFARDVSERRRIEDERARQGVLKDQFLATLSHELRTPLTSILGYTRLLRGPSLAGAAATRALAVIERNALAQVQIVNDLLDVSGIVLGTFRLERERIELGPLVTAEVEAARIGAVGASLTLTCDVDAAPLAADGDGTRLRQTIRHLLANAIKFTPAGGRVEVALERDGDDARLIVRDTGIGIEPALLPQIFERFRQGDSSLTRAYSGLGVGLALVRHIVEEHGGSITVQSPGAGAGTTFTVRVPLAAAARQPVVEAEPAPTADLNGVNVLVVEDEAETRDLVATVLTACGARVTATASADEALRALPRVKPDVVVSDIGMPNGDGYDLIRRLRTLDPADGGATPAAALTAAAATSDRRRALEAGFEVHVAKPFEPAHLARVVATLARRRAA